MPAPSTHAITALCLPAPPRRGGVSPRAPSRRTTAIRPSPLAGPVSVS